VKGAYAGERQGGKDDEWRDKKGETEGKVGEGGGSDAASTWHVRPIKKKK